MEQVLKFKLLHPWEGSPVGKERPLNWTLEVTFFSGALSPVLTFLFPLKELHFTE